MSSIATRYLLAAAALIVATSSAGMAAAEEARCFDSWSDAAPIVHREGLITIERLDKLARMRASGKIINSTLCRKGSRYIYKLVVRSPHGPLRTLVVDARHPFEK